MFTSLLVACITANAQTTCNIKPYIDKVYIFDANTPLQECDGIGKNLSSKIVADQGTTFKVVFVDNDCNLVIVFDAEFKDPQKQAEFNFIGNVNQIKSFTRTDKNDLKKTRHFLLKKDDFTNSASEYKPSPKWNLNFGTFTTPFKFRPTKSIFTNNLSLGTSIDYQRKIDNSDFGWGLIAGISLTSVTLDSLSTNYKIKTSTDRPAMTLSLSALFSYKNVNFTFGIGRDYINRNSTVEQSWIFNGKTWIGFGIGLSLFNTSPGAGNTDKSGEQK